MACKNDIVYAHVVYGFFIFFLKFKIHEALVRMSDSIFEINFSWEYVICT